MHSHVLALRSALQARRCWLGGRQTLLTAYRCRFHCSTVRGRRSAAPQAVFGYWWLSIQPCPGCHPDLSTCSPPVTSRDMPQELGGMQRDLGGPKDPRLAQMVGGKAAFDDEALVALFQAPGVPRVCPPAQGSCAVSLVLCCPARASHGSRMLPTPAGAVHRPDTLI